MELSTARRLSNLNLRFYTEHAENFGDARPRLAAGVQRVLAGIAPGGHVLELGCGDGKVGRALARAGVAYYLGLDVSEAMLERARRLTKRLPDRDDMGDFATEVGPAATELATPTFRRADLSDPHWHVVLPKEPFDWILCFAAFHHLPGMALRVSVMRTLAARLAPTGRIALSNWQFTRSERLIRHVVPWAQAGMDEGDIEPGDYLLSWERKGRHGLRYVHLIDEAEIRQLAAKSGLRVLEAFRSDGVTYDLADYALLEGGANVH